MKPMMYATATRTSYSRSPLTLTSSKPTGRYQPTGRGYISAFYSILRRWKSETVFLSNPEQIVSHDGFQVMVANANLFAPLIVEELRKSPSNLVWVFEEAFPIQPYSNEARGNIEAISDAWIEWWNTDRVGQL